MNITLRSALGLLMGHGGGNRADSAPPGSQRLIVCLSVSLFLTLFLSFERLRAQGPQAHPSLLGAIAVEVASLR